MVKNYRLWTSFKIFLSILNVFFCYIITSIVNLNACATLHHNAIRHFLCSFEIKDYILHKTYPLVQALKPKAWALFPIGRALKAKGLYFL